MEYTKHVWQTGEYISTELLNHIEDGIGRSDERADQIEETLAAKAEADDLDAASAAIEQLQTRMTDAEADAEVQKKTKADQADVAGIAAEVDQQKSAINRLETALEGKASVNDVAGVGAAVDLEHNELERLRVDVMSKASAADLSGALVILEKKVGVEDVERLEKNAATKSDMAAAGVEIDRLQTTVNTLSATIGSVRSDVADISSAKVNKPTGSGVNGQVLTTNGDGTTRWTDPSTPTGAQIGEAVSDWLSDHPEATTTVGDGSITEAKLAPEVLNLIGNGDDKDAQVVAAAMDARNYAESSRQAEIVYQVNTADIWLNRLKDHAMRYLNHGYGFLFFSDPHNMSPFPFGSSPYSLIEDLRHIRAIYEHTPAKTVLCGGDWMNNYHKAEDVPYMSGRIQKLLKTEIGPEAWTVLGNHDVGEASDLRLSSTQVAQMWYGRDQLYFVLDAAEDVDIYMLEMGYSQVSISSQQWEELAWIANRLMNNTKAHLFGVGHICLGTDGDFFGRAVCGLLEAFNQKRSITTNGATYDFTNAVGTFHFILAGHYHRDVLFSHAGMPVVAIDDFATAKAIDLAFADWEGAKLYLDRIGDGESRVIDIIPTGGSTPED